MIWERPLHTFYYKNIVYTSSNANISLEVKNNLRILRLSDKLGVLIKKVCILSRTGDSYTDYPDSLLSKENDFFRTFVKTE